MVAFLLSPIGKVLVFAVALFIWTAYQRDQAADEAREECQAEQLRDTLKEMTRQRDAAVAALDDAREQAKITDAEMAALEDKRIGVNNDAKELKERECVVPESVTRRLSDIK